MNSTLLKQSENVTPTTNSQSGVEYYRNMTDRWLQETIVWGIGIGICSFLAGLGFYFLSTEGLRPVNLVVAFLGVVGNGTLLRKALKRYEFYQDNTPKITLSADAICDHRTGVNVEFLDAESFYFDQMFHKSGEIRASLHLGLKNGDGHFFDLKHLNVPSNEIAKKVQSNSGLEPVKPAESPDPGQDRLLSTIAVLAVGLFILRIVFGFFGVEV